MSKQLKKRLEQLFTDFEQVEQVPVETGGDLPVVETRSKVGPVSIQAETIQIESNQPLPPKSRFHTGALPALPEGYVAPDSRSESALSLPFRMDTNSWGTLEIASPAVGHIWSQDEQLLVKQVVDQLSIALENARLFQQTQRQAEELAVLNEMARELSSLLDIKGITETIYQHTSQLMDTSTFFIVLYDKDTNTLSFPITIDKNQRMETASRPLGGGFTDYIIQKKQPVFIANDVTGAIRKMGLELILVGEKHPAKCWMGVPMVLGDRVIGVISVQNEDRPNVFNTHDQELLTAIASQAAIAFENSRLFEDSRQRNEELSILNEVVGSASRSLDLNSILSDVLNQVLSFAGLDAGLISLFNPSIQKLELSVSTGLPEAMEKRLATQGMEGTLCAVVFDTKDSVLLDDLSKGGPVNVSGVIAAGFSSYVGIPLESGGEVLGTLCAFHKKTISIQSNTMNLLRSIGRQIGFAIQNASLFQDTERRAEELASLNNLSRLLASQLDLDQVLEEVYRGVSGLLNVQNFYIGLYNPEENNVSIVINTSESTVDREIKVISADEGLTGQVISSHEPILIKDDVKGWLEERNIPAIGEIGFSWLGVPLLIGDQMMGVMAVQNYKKTRPFSEHDRDLMLAIGNQASIAIQNTRFFEQIRRRNEYLAASAEISRLVTSTLDLPTIFSRTVALIRDRFGFYHASIFTMDESGFNAILREGTGKPGETMKAQGHSLPIGSNSIVGKVASKGEAIIVNNVAEDRIFRPNPLLPETQAEAAFPLRVGPRIIGVLDLQAKDINVFKPDEMSVLQTLADQVSVSIDNARSYELVQEAVKEMRELDRLKTQFLANMSHELRTPLNSIIGF